MLSSSFSMLRQISRNIYFKPQTRRCYSVSRQCLTSAMSVSNKNDQSLVVTWNDGNASKYPYLYLRENCRCSKCYKEAYNSRIIFVPKTIDLNISAKSVDLKTSGELNVEWKDGHSSTYSPEFLKQLSYKKAGEGLPPGILKKGVNLWGSELGEGKLPVFDFEKVLGDKDELYKWLVTVMSTTGIAKFVNVPTKIGQLERLGSKIGYLASTFYGQSEYEIRAFSEEKSKDIGYSNAPLAVHTDYSFCSTAPVVAMLHYVEQTASNGGENLFVDAFHAAKILHEEDPEGFKLLTEAVRFNNVTMTKIGNYHNIVHRSIISLGRDGKLTAVAYSDEFRDAHMPHPPELMDIFYRAYFRFTELLHDKRTSFYCKMESGEMVTMNNHRVMHGRSGYEDNGNNVRHLQLGYFDWDCVHAKLRVMAKERGVECPVD